MVRSAMLLSAAFPELGTQAKALTARLTELVRVMTEIRTQRDQLRTEMTRLNDARTRLAGPDGGEEGHARRAPVGAEAHAHGRRRHLAQRQRSQRADLASSTRRSRTTPGSAPTTSSASRRRPTHAEHYAEFISAHSRRTRPPRCRRCPKRRPKNAPAIAPPSTSKGHRRRRAVAGRDTRQPRPH